MAQRANRARGASGYAGMVAPSGLSVFRTENIGGVLTMAISSHESPVMGSDTWLTPPEIIRALGVFDLDVCCPPNMPWKTATRHFTEREDGLTQPWAGRVWCNPPYSREAVVWLRKMVQHGNGCALTFARTETRAFFETVWRAASACLFIEGRLRFHYPDGRRAKANAGAPSVLIAYGKENADILKTCSIAGKFVPLNN